MKKERKRNAKGDGYFYRRYKQKHYAIDADVPGTIYYCIGGGKNRVRISCHTQDEKTARQLVQKHFLDINLSSDQKFLETVAKAGDRARKKLDLKTL